MPNKYPVKKGWDVPKLKYKVTNWSDYNAALCQRGEIDVWLSLDAVINDNSSPMRNRNIEELKTNGRMAWQRNREYGRRNISELAVQRYQRILGDSMHPSVMGAQKMKE